MAIVSVEIPDRIAQMFQPFTIVKYETLIEKSDSNVYLKQNNKDFEVESFSETELSELKKEWKKSFLSICNSLKNI